LAAKLQTKDIFLHSSLEKCGSTSIDWKMFDVLLGKPCKEKDLFAILSQKEH